MKRFKLPPGAPNIGMRIRIARAAAGMTQASLARECGYASSRIGNYETGAREPSLDDLHLIATALQSSGFGREWFFAIDQNPVLRAPPPFAVVRALEEPDVETGREVMVPVMDTRLNGESELCPLCKVSVQIAWLELHNASPQDIFVMPMRGKSMKGLFSDGDWVVFHRGHTTISHGEVYAFAVDDDADVSIRRLLQDTNGSVMTLPENSMYPRPSFPVEKIKILGMAIGRAGDMPPSKEA